MDLLRPIPWAWRRARSQELVRATALCVVAALLAAQASASSSAVKELPADLTEISLDELSNIKVTSVAKKQQRLSRAAAAVYVVTSEDIRRSGATSLPEALRMVPGLHVAKIDANKWAVSARGFSGRFSNKLLVLIDGRTIYTPLFSGVFWDMHDVVMEDIDRIEVIRGPGATVWGANAVNGVINVITKRSVDTQGGFASVGVGSLDGPQLTVRQGGEVGKGHYRVYGKLHNRFSSPGDTIVPVPVDDSWASARGGFKFETSLSRKDDLELQGEINRMDGMQRSFRASLAQARNIVDTAGLGGKSGFLLGRWRHSSSERSEVSVQGYYDAIQRNETGIYDVSFQTADVELQHRFSHSSRAELNWGLGLRSAWVNLTGSDSLHPTRPECRLQYASAFAQEEIQIQPDKLTLTLGAKLEETTLGGFTFQPSTRAIWMPSDKFSLWGAASRAARAPSLGEQGVRFDVHATDIFGGAALVSLFPNPQLGNEFVTALEAGVRLSPARRWHFDLTAFRNQYDDVFSLKTDPLQRETTPDQSYLLVPVRFGNETKLRSTGFEALAQWRPLDPWRLTGSYSRLELREIDPPESAYVENLAHKSSPRHVAAGRSSWNLPRGVEIDLSASYVGSTIATGFLRRGEVFPAFVRADARVEWKESERLRIGAGAQNLFDGHRYEFDAESLSVGSPAGRNFYGKVTWSF